MIYNVDVFGSVASHEIVNTQRTVYSRAKPSYNAFNFYTKMILACGIRSSWLRRSEKVKPRRTINFLTKRKILTNLAVFLFDQDCEDHSLFYTTNVFARSKNIAVKCSFIYENVTYAVFKTKQIVYNSSFVTESILAISLFDFWNHVRGVFNKFQDFFVQASKIDVDSWNFSSLLLYTLWDDWPIFMISGSNNSYSRNWNTPYWRLIVTAG